MRGLRFHLGTFAAWVAVIALGCGWFVTWNRWQPSRPRPSERTVAALLAARAERLGTRGSSSGDWLLWALLVGASLAASQARQRFGATADRGAK